MAIQTTEYLKGRFSAGKFPTSQDYTDLVDTCATQNPYQEVIESADSNFQSLYQLVTDNSLSQFTPIATKDLICALCSNSVTASDHTSIYANLMNVTVINSGAMSSDASGDSNLYIQLPSTDIIVIPNGNAVKFVRSQATAYTSTDNWSVVGNPIGITIYELSEKAQGAGGGGQDS